MWLHFTRMSSYDDSDIQIIVRGEGNYVFDQHGNLDGLAGLLVAEIGHGRTEVAEAAAPATLPALVLCPPRPSS